MTMKGTTLWDLTLCSPAEVHQHFQRNKACMPEDITFHGQTGFSDHVLMSSSFPLYKLHVQPI
jgi:hypothetical protein